MTTILHLRHWSSSFPSQGSHSCHLLCTTSMPAQLEKLLMLSARGGLEGRGCKQTHLWLNWPRSQTTKHGDGSLHIAYVVPSPDPSHPARSSVKLTSSTESQNCLVWKRPQRSSHSKPYQRALFTKAVYPTWSWIFPGMTAVKLWWLTGTLR